MSKAIISCRISAGIKDAILDKADDLGVTLSEYCEHVLIESLDEKDQSSPEEEIATIDPLIVEELLEALPFSEKDRKRIEQYLYTAHTHSSLDKAELLRRLLVYAIKELPAQPDLLGVMDWVGR